MRKFVITCGLVDIITLLLISPLLLSFPAMKNNKQKVDIDIPDNFVSFYVEKKGLWSLE